jgi:hypothetical protein
MGERRDACNVLFGRKLGLDVIWLRKMSVAGSYEHGKEPSGSIKGGEFLDSLNYY